MYYSEKTFKIIKKSIRGNENTYFTLEIIKVEQKHNFSNMTIRLQKYNRGDKENQNIVELYLEAIRNIII